MLLPVTSDGYLQSYTEGEPLLWRNEVDSNVKMKFGKEFKKQKVPEWTEAYVDYNGLKRILQAICRFKQSKQLSRDSQQRPTLQRAFSGLNLQASDAQSSVDIEDQVIAVNTVQPQGSRKLYNTDLLMSPEEGHENEIMFFKKLDAELNKVNTFHKDKVEEVIKEAALLHKQMDAFIALRIKVKSPILDESSSLRRLATDIDSTAPSRTTTPSRVRTVETEIMNTKLEADMARKSQLEESMAGAQVNTVSTVSSSSVCSDPLEVLDHVKINNTLDSPISTIKSVLYDSKEKELSFNKEELKKVEQRMKPVLIEFYQKLLLLKHFSFMNLSAFSKIMKKYEKITSRRASRSYMKIVDNSYLGNSDEITGLLDRVEATFIKYFSNSNRREGMKILRPKRKSEKHSITFFSGFFSGCSIALLVAVILLIETRQVLDNKERSMYIEGIFPLYSLYAYIILHMLLYAANIYFWRLYRINYPFIFGFEQGTELGYREVSLFSTGLAVLALATFLVHLHVKMDSRTQDYEKYIGLIPLGLFSVILVITFCPFRIMYSSSRFFLIQCMFRCICAPLYTVTLPDFFLADQLSSQVQAIRSFGFYTCYYGFWGGSSQIRNKCHDIDVYNAFYFIIAVIPYWIRFLQCLRQLFEDRDLMYCFNGLRYFLTIVAVVIGTSFELKKGTTWKVLAPVSSFIATMTNTYWDIVVDWGLLQRRSKNLFLRDKLLVSHKSVYFAAMVLDIILRFAWLQLVLKFNVRCLRGTAVTSLFSCLEILRRGMWNFFRLENEHLNNVGKYRAFKSVPLPFNYYDEENPDNDNDKDA